jgi:hypothetical protein
MDADVVDAVAVEEDVLYISTVVNQATQLAIADQRSRRQTIMLDIATFVAKTVN